jgi:hypothetical protein
VTGVGCVGCSGAFLESKLIMEWRERGEKDCTPMHPVHGLRGWMALEIDTLQCSVGVAAPRDARLRRGAAGQGGLGSPFRMSLPLVRSSAGDWGMSGRGSRVNG